MTFGTDAEGFDWLGTLEGPYRFDGQRLAPRMLRGADSVQRLVHSDFFPDRRGATWYSTPDALIRTSPKGNRVVRPADLQAVGARDWQMIAYDSLRDAFLVATAEKLWTVGATPPYPARAVAANRSVRFLQVAPPADGTAVSPSGVMWLGFPWLLGNGVDRIVFDGEGAGSTTVTEDATLAGLTVSGGATDHLGRCWLASDSGLVAYAPSADRVLAIHPPPSRASARVYQVAAVDTLLYVATAAGGAWVFDPSRGRYVSPVEVIAGDEPCVNTRWIHASERGVLYVTCAGGGVDVLAPVGTRPRLLSVEAAAEVAPVGFAPSGEGGFWVRTQADRLYLLAGDSLLPRSACAAPDGAAATREPHRDMLLAGSGDTVWLARGRTLYARTGADSRDCHVARVCEEAILGIFPSSRGTPWILTRAGFEAPGGGTVPGYRPGRINYLASRRAGVDSVVISRDGTSVELLHIGLEGCTRLESLPALGSVAATLVTPQAWFVGGLDGVRVYTLTELGEWRLREHRLPEIAVEDLLPRRGRWPVVLGVDGVYILGEGRHEVLGRERGLRFGTAGAVGALAAPDRLIFDSDAGPASIRLPMAPRVARTNRVYPIGAWLDGRPLELADLDAPAPLSLAPSSERLDLALGTVGNFDLASPLIEYRLRGAGTGPWTTATGGLVRLTSLTPGALTVEARARQANGSVTPVYAIRVAVLPPLYQRPGFLIGTGLALAGLIAVGSYLVYRRRLARERVIHARERLVSAERERISRELHDDLGGGLASILFLTEDERRGLTPEEQRRVAELSRTSLTNMRDIIWMLDGPSATVGGVARRLASIAEDFCGDRGVPCVTQVNLPPDVAERPLGFLAGRNLYLVGKEAINNALRHGRATRLTLTWTATEDVAELVIANEGQGFDPDRVTRGSGLSNMYHRASEIEASLQIESAPDSGGTRVLLRYHLPNGAGGTN